MSAIPCLYFSREQIQKMVDHAIRDHPHEACGLVIGTDHHRVERVIAIDNCADDPQHHYQMNPQALARALHDLDAAGHQWLAVYHSHPHGDAVPSRDDIDQHGVHLPNIAQIIIGMEKQRIQIQGWSIEGIAVQPIDLMIGRGGGKVHEAQALSKRQVWAILLTIIISVGIVLIISFVLLPPAPPIPTAQ